MLSPGTIIAGTLRPEDLIPALRDALRDAGHDPADVDEMADVRWGWLAIAYLLDALQAYAPEGHYVGSHPGDGADFGVWPCEK